MPASKWRETGQEGSVPPYRERGPGGELRRGDFRTARTARGEVLRHARRQRRAVRHAEAARRGRRQGDPRAVRAAARRGPACEAAGAARRVGQVPGDEPELHRAGGRRGVLAGARGGASAAGVGEGAHLAELRQAGRHHRAAELEHRVLASRRSPRAARAGAERAGFQRRRRGERDHGGGDGFVAAAPAGFWRLSRPGHRGDNRGLRAVVAESGASHDHVGPGRATARGARQRAAGVDGQPGRSVLPGNRVHADVPCRGGRPGGPVAVGPAECGAVHLSLNGRDEPDLQPTGAYRATVMKIAGLHWKLG